MPVLQFLFLSFYLVLDSPSILLSPILESGDRGRVMTLILAGVTPAQLLTFDTSHYAGFLGQSSGEWKY